MMTRRWFVSIVVLAMLCTALVLPSQIAAAEGGIVEGSVTSTAFGTFNGVAYTKYTGKFVGTTAGDYAVAFEIVAPSDPTKGNGILVLEPMHVMGGTAGRDAYFTSKFLFDRGFSYAGIWWHPETVNPMVSYSAEEANQILHNFALALRQDPAMQKMVGTLQKLYGIGVSKTCEPMLTMLMSPAQSLVDFALLMVPSWPQADFTPPAGATRIMVLNVEADRILSALSGGNSKALQQNTVTYRSYEVAGAPHIPDVPRMRELSLMYGTTPEGTTPLDWTPVMRALFIAGHKWVTEGIEPPPSTHLWDAPFGQIDPTYKDVYGLDLVTGINRDEMGNALGGIRLPDVALGRGVYIATDPASFFGMGLFGAFLDKQCEPLADGSPRFADHAAYVAEFTAQAQALVDQRFLLPEDAQRLVDQAAASNVGDPIACMAAPSPALLPATGAEDEGAFPIPLLALIAFILVGVGIGLRKLGKASR
jgi:hypothetical protein